MTPPTSTALQAKFTRLSKALCVLLLAGFAVQYFVPSTRNYLCLVPGRTLPCVWNLITAGFVITNPFLVVTEAIAILFLARAVEPMYGSKEFLKFLFIVDFTACLTTFAWVYIAFAILVGVKSDDAGKVLYTEFAGFHGIVGGLLVAVKQIMPDHELKLFGVLGFKTKWLPSFFVILSCMACLGLKQWTYLPFIIFGTYNSWLYLRFFQQQPETNLKGDPSEDFKFSSFFPAFLHPIVDRIAAVLAVIFRLKHTQSSEGKAYAISNAPSIVGSDSADASRRRERGAKALEERLGMKKGEDGDDELQGVTVSS